MLIFRGTHTPTKLIGHASQSYFKTQTRFCYMYSFFVRVVYVYYFYIYFIIFILLRYRIFVY